MSVSAGVAVGAATSVPVGIIVVAAAQLLGTRLLLSSTFRIDVTPTNVSAGPATLPRWAIGSVEPLNREQLRQTLGVNADPRAWLLVRPWTKTAVKITLKDVHDPHPYWVVGTRRPQALREALR